VETKSTEAPREASKLRAPAFAGRAWAASGGHGPYLAAVGPSPRRISRLSGALVTPVACCQVSDRRLHREARPSAGGSKNRQLTILRAMIAPSCVREISANAHADPELHEERPCSASPHTDNSL